MKRKQRIENWLKNIVNRTVAELEEVKMQTSRRAMRNPPHPRTFVGRVFLGRNDPCYCGNTYGGGSQPVKFKDCCWRKHAVLPSGTMTPVLAQYLKKQKVYFDKNGKVLR